MKYLHDCLGVDLGALTVSRTVQLRDKVKCAGVDQVAILKVSLPTPSSSSLEID